MRFLFVHSGGGVSLAEWVLREAIATHCSLPISFRSIEVSPSGVPIDDDFVRLVAVWKPDLVGFSCHYWSLPTFLEVSSWVKHLHPSAKIVMGGPHVSSVSMAEYLMDGYEQIDFMIRGAGEQGLCRLLEHLAEEGRGALDGISGLSHRIDGKYVHEPVEFISSAARGKIFHPGNVELSEHLAIASGAAYETVIGCRGRCTFCIYTGQQLEYLDDTMVEEELSYLCEFEIPHIRICDAHFGGTAPRAKKLLRHLAKVNRCSSIDIYPDLNHVDQEYMTLIREAGATVTSIGIQSTHPETLQLIGRSADSDRAREIELLLEAYPNIPADIIIGLPGDDVITIERTLQEVLDLGFSSVGIKRLCLFPGTKLAEDPPDGFVAKTTARTFHCQLLSSSNLPPEQQDDVSRLAYSTEIAAPLKATRDLLRRTRGEKILDLIQECELDTLLDLRERILTEDPVKLLRRFSDTVRQIAHLIGDTARCRESIIRDLATHVQLGCTLQRRPELCWWDREAGRRRIALVTFRLPTQGYLSWDLQRRSLDFRDGSLPRGSRRGTILHLLEDPDSE